MSQLTEREPVADDGALENTINVKNQAFLLICVCFFLSGFAALLYETVWLRQFAIILGTSEQALAVVLAAYMGGLSIGAWVASRKVDSIRRPVLVYGLLEAGIAIWAIAMPLGQSLVEWLQIQLFGGMSEPPPAGSLGLVAFGLISSFALILPPTAMMGATLPLLAKYVVRSDRELGPKIGLLYAINTIGAVAGTLVAAFILLPALGLGQTTWVGAAVNFLVFLLVWMAARQGETVGSRVSATIGERPTVQLAPSKGKVTSQQPASEMPMGEDIEIRYRWILWFIAISGAVSFCYEIVFTRMLGHIFGGSVFAFATMLAGFLLGIALGGAIASRLAVRRDSAVKYFAYAQSLTGIFALAAFWSINSVAGGSLEALGGHGTTLAQVLVSILILLPSATCVGASFPLAIRIFAKDETEAATGAAKVYLWNTVGAITGSLLTGMFLLPLLAYHNSTILAIVLNAALAISVALLMPIPRQHAIAGVISLVFLLLFIPTAPEKLIRVSALTGELIEGDLVFNKVGRSGTVSVFEDLGEFRFQTNGLPEATVTPRGAGMPFAFEGAWLANLPTLVRPGSQSMLIVGLGGGSAASYVPPSIRSVDVFELEPAVVEANAFIRGWRRRDPLSDPRVHIVLNDGRNGLSLTRKKYDVIVSQPSHPWTAGASHLYTREFNEIVRDRLQPGGVFLQWMDAEFVDIDLLRSMAATLLQSFPHVRLYEPMMNSLLFVVSDQPIHPERIDEALLEIAAEDRAHFREFGIIKPTDLLALLKMDDAALRDFAGGAPPITDERNLLAMRAPALAGKRNARETIKAIQAWEPVYFYSDGVTELCPTVNYRALAIRMRGRMEEDYASRIQELIDEPVEKALLEATLAQFRGETPRWERELKLAAEVAPDDPRPAYLILAFVKLGTHQPIDEETQQVLIGRLDDRYRKMYSAVVALSKDDLDSVKSFDSTLATFQPDEVGYELASRMRVLWRINDGSPRRPQSGLEALVITRDATPSLGPESVALFQTLAAVNANRPHVAIATTMTFAKSIVARAEKARKGEDDPDQVRGLLLNLARCRSVLSDPIVMRSVNSYRARQVTQYLDQLLAGTPPP